MSSAEFESDAEIMARVQAGELERFATLISRYQPALLRVARSRLGDAAGAEDVVQETLLAVYKARQSFDTRRNFRTWLWTILINQCTAHAKRRSRWMRFFSRAASEHSERPADDRPLTDEHAVEPISRLLAAERSELLERLLAQLTPAQADALRLRFFGELKFHEIAAALGCSLLTAKNRVRVGLLRLSQMIAASEAGSSPDEQPVRPFGRKPV